MDYSWIKALCNKKKLLLLKNFNAMASGNTWQNCVYWTSNIIDPQGFSMNSSYRNTHNMQTHEIGTYTPHPPLKSCLRLLAEKSGEGTGGQVFICCTYEGSVHETGYIYGRAETNCFSEGL